MPLEKENKHTLDYIRKTFNWGNIVTIHTISNFQIVECLRKDKKMFCIYIDYEEQGVYTDTLDTAIITALSLKYDASEMPGIMFGRMIGIETQQKG